MNGKRLKEILDKRNISQNKLANDVGIAPASVSKLVNGYNGGNVSTLKKICEYLEIDPKEIW